MIPVGNNIRRIRQERGLTQWQLSRAVGVTPGKILLVERGEKCSRELLESIADALGVDVTKLCGG